MIDALNDMLACPRCQQPLAALHCPACRVDYPLLGDVPWLFADPQAAVSDWRNRWHFALARLDDEQQRARAALAARPAPATARRLERLAAGYESQRVALKQLLAPLELAQGGALETHLALRTRLPSTLGITSYDANVHRDWCWGETETRAALAELQALIDDPGSDAHVLVIGAGAGRLAYDLHQATTSALTLAVDVNPLLTWVGHRVSRGETVHLTEFPLAPRTADQVAVCRALSAPRPARPGLEFVLADLLRLPLRPGQFDLVITPWLLDVVEADTHWLVQRINQLLRPDGRWLNQGSVAFQNAAPERRYTLEELTDMAQALGFATPEVREAELPYMACPDSRHARRELVASFAARKLADAPRPGRRDALPDWIVTGRAPIPALPAFQTQAMTTRVHAFIMSLIDGRRTLRDMAKVMEQQQLMPYRDAEQALRGFLIKMYDEAQRAQGL